MVSVCHTVGCSSGDNVCNVISGLTRHVGLRHAASWLQGDVVECNVTGVLISPGPDERQLKEKNPYEGHSLVTDTACLKVRVLVPRVYFVHLILRYLHLEGLLPANLC